MARTYSQLNETNFKLTGIQLELLSTKTKLSFMETKFDDKITSLETLLHQHNWHLQLRSATQVSSPGKEVIPVTVHSKWQVLKQREKVRNNGLAIHFYTNSKGCWICWWVGADCFSGEGTNFSMTLYLMQGEYDDGVL